MAAPRFDRSKDYGICFPVINGAAFYQKGWHFTESGEIVRALCTPEQLAILDGKAAEPAPKVEKKRGRPPKMPESVEEDGSDVDFAAWLTGRQKAPDHHVLAKARTDFGDEMETIEQVKEHLVHVEQIVDEDDVKV
jgi:hypothetical protein